MKNIISFRILILGLIISFFSGCEQIKQKFGKDPLDRDEVSVAIKNAIDSMNVKQYFADKDVRKHLYQEFADFYKNRDYKLAWSSAKKPLPQSEQLFSAISKAYEDGLDSSSYRLSELKQMQNEIFSEKLKKKELDERIKKLVKLDFYMTSSYLTYASHLHAGRIDPTKLDTNWIDKPRKKPLASHLENALQNNKVEASLFDLLPRTEQYKQIKAALADYRKMEANGGWPAIPAGSALTKGSKGEKVLLLKKRLAMTGDLDTTQTGTVFTDVYDQAVEDAVKRFQERNGYASTGKIDAQTLALMNVPVSQRRQQIELNMERLRWLPDTIGKDYVMVNVPSYDLKLYEGGKETMEMKIIVGKEFASTPIFSDTIEFIVFSPDWTVPLTIAKEEILPILQKDPSYLDNQNMAVFASWNVKDTTKIDHHAEDWSAMTPEEFNYRIVQLPGKKNPLGSIKFMFPNDLHIYLHDTPADQLFDRNRRTLSHGCVRVERPVDLAERLLTRAPGTWDKASIEQKMNMSQPDTVFLEKKVPVEIVYQTALIDKNGKINFRDDIYGHDRKQFNAIVRKEKTL